MSGSTFPVASRLNQSKSWKQSTMIRFTLVLSTLVAIALSAGPARLKRGYCLPEWSNQCQGDYDCCSQFCYKPGDWKLGLCRGVGTCRPDWDNHWKSSSDCCSSNCYRPGDWEWGVCYPPQDYLNRLSPCSTAPGRKRRAIGYVCKEVFRPCKQGFLRITTSDGRKTDYCKRVFSG